MRMYFFDATVRVQHEGRSVEVVLYKAARAEDELTARRAVLNRFFEGGFQVVRLERVEERSPDVSMDR